MNGYMRAKFEACPNRANHTTGPDGYAAWHEWAAKKTRTHIQRKCEGCGLWEIWEPKKPKKEKSQKTDEERFKTFFQRFDMDLTLMEAGPSKRYFEIDNNKRLFEHNAVLRIFFDGAGKLDVIEVIGD